jgi:hypothetical protein
MIGLCPFQKDLGCASENSESSYPITRQLLTCGFNSIAMLSISSVLAAIFSNFQFSLHETDDETMDWKDQTLMVNKKHIMTLVRPLPPTQRPMDFHSVASVLEKGLSNTKIPMAIQEPDTVILPDLFVCWSADPIKLNPHYSTVAPQAEEWFKV